MKKTTNRKAPSKKVDEMRPEYEFDYTQARPNRFAGQEQEQMVVLIDPEVARVFETPEAVNRILRALISNMPRISDTKK